MNEINKELKRLEDQLEKLKDFAIKRGYLLINGKYVKKEMVPVIEFYMHVKTLHESTGTYLTVRGTLAISETNFEAFKLLGDEEEIIEYLVEYCDHYNEIKPLFDAFEYLGNYDLDKISTEFTKEDALIFYSKVEDDPDSFAKEINIECEAGEGYISIYKMDSRDFLKLHDYVYAKSRKHLRFN